MTNLLNWTTRQHQTEFKVYREYLINRLQLVEGINNELEIMQLIIKKGSNATLLHKFQLYFCTLSIKPKRSITQFGLNTDTERDNMLHCYGPIFFVVLQFALLSEIDQTRTALSVNNFVGLP